MTVRTLDPANRHLAQSPRWNAARVVLGVLRAEGYEAYLAGGCVRDMLLGHEPKDYDVATSATPDVVLDLFPRTFAVGAHFGVVLVSMEMDGVSTLTEVATFRSDGVYSDGRRPDEVRYTLSAEEDVERRDFTINGLLLDPETWLSGSPVPDLRAAVLDYVNGVADLETGVIRAIGDAVRRCEEDHLRMLRAVRFAARFEFAIEAATMAAIQSLAPKIRSVSNERVREELTRMLTEGHARRAFELLDDTGLLVHVLPEVARLKGVAQPPQFHPEGDVWLHTLQLLQQLEPGCALTLAWGALLHDIGKPATFQAPSGPDDRIRFNGHVEVGVRIAAEICGRLRFSNEETAQILGLVENHMRFADAQRMSASTLKRFFRLNNFPEHLALHRMDCRASSLDLTGHLDNYEFARERYENMPPEQVRPEPLLTGWDLIAMGYRPGPAFKTMLHAVEEAQLEGAIQSSEEAARLIQTQFAPPERARGDA
jgi:poly(A) polymerase